MTCNVACGNYHEATQQCKITMALNRYLGDIDGPVKKAPTAPTSSLVSNAMKGIPDMSQIDWLIKGNNPAPSTAPFAYAFVFEYDVGAKKSTDKMRGDAVELYQYLKDNNNNLVLDGFTYSLNKTETLFARNKAR